MIGAQLDDIVPSPWPVGQRIQQRDNPSVRGVVTELTARGFKYRLDEPQTVGPTRWGQQSIEGEVYCRSWERWGGFEIECITRWERDQKELAAAKVRIAELEGVIRRMRDDAEWWI